MQGIISLLISMLVGFKPLGAMVPAFIIFAFLIALFYTALGTAIASLMEDMQGFQLIMNFLAMPTFFPPGALFPLEGLPSFLEQIVAINPLSYGIDGLRGTSIGTSHFGIVTDFGVLSATTITALAIGSYLFSRIQT